MGALALLSRRFRGRRIGHYAHFDISTLHNLHQPPLIVCSAHKVLSLPILARQLRIKPVLRVSLPLERVEHVLRCVQFHVRYGGLRFVGTAHRAFRTVHDIGENSFRFG